MQLGVVPVASTGHCRSDQILVLAAIWQQLSRMADRGSLALTTLKTDNRVASISTSDRTFTSVLIDEHMHTLDVFLFASALQSHLSY